MRKKIIAGNWKMNNTNAQTKELINVLKDKCNTTKSDVVFCVPYTNLALAIEMTKGTNIKIGAQNLHFEDVGAFTGEISVSMLKEIGVEYVIIGHSERRQYFNETDETVNKKTIKALSAGLVPITCVGESLAEREDCITTEVVRKQTKLAFKGISANDAKKVVIAYEPIWAIGTGKVATDEQAEQACADIRQVICEIYDKKTADEIRIQYGGSVTKDSANALFNMPNIDGGLVGGASLKADFAEIVNY